MKYLVFCWYIKLYSEMLLHSTKPHGVVTQSLPEVLNLHGILHIDCMSWDGVGVNLMCVFSTPFDQGLLNGVMLYVVSFVMYCNKCGDAFQMHQCEPSSWHSCHTSQRFATRIRTDSSQSCWTTFCRWLSSA